MKKYYRIYDKCINESLYVYTDYDEFAKVYCPDMKKGEDNIGYNSGNGIWIDITDKDWRGFVVHELSHYLDWMFEDEFYGKNCGEIRARLHQYYYDKIINHFHQVGNKVNKK